MVEYERRKFTEMMEYETDQRENGQRQENTVMSDDQRRKRPEMMDYDMNRQQYANIRKSPNMKDDVCGSYTRK